MSKSKTLADTIRETIDRDGRSIYRLSLDTGVNQGVLGRFVRGERDLRLETADKVCKALGLELKTARRKAKGR